MDQFVEMKNINKWLSVISNCVPFPAKKDDFSRVLLNIFTQFSEDTINDNYDKENGDEEGDNETDADDDADEDNETDEDDEEDEQDENMHNNENGNGQESLQKNTSGNGDGEDIDYNAIYSYFNEILNRRFPFQLQDKEAVIALSLMTNIQEMVESLENKNETAFLQAESWWKPTSSITNGTVNGQADNPDETTNGTTNNGADNEINRNQPEYYEDLPRFRKIRDCLNPLKVPSWILNDNHDLLSLYLI